jgi:5,10-methylene-tetrahydrofolate dehydrogenase/methenyl tetrahydrofolate cyclohydrolase
MLLDDGFTVSIAHSKTKDVRPGYMEELIEKHSVIISATGRKLSFDKELLKDKFIIDVSDDIDETFGTVHINMKQIGRRNAEIMINNMT